jgi:hypothetical protein
MTAGITLRSLRPLKKNTPRGFCTVSFGALWIIDCTIHVHANGRAWVGLPGKPVLDEAARHKREPNGKWVYVPMAEWRDRDASDRFSAAVLEILKQKYPHALDGEDAP